MAAGTPTLVYGKFGVSDSSMFTHNPVTSGRFTQAESLEWRRTQQPECRQKGPAGSPMQATLVIESGLGARVGRGEEVENCGWAQGWMSV